MPRGRVTVAEMTGRGVTLVVDLVEENNHLRYEVTGPRFLARLPQCGCDLPGCAGLGWGRNCKAYTDPGGKYAHGQQACHGGPASGYHEEHAVALAETLLKTFPSKTTAKHKPGVIPRQNHRDLNRAVNHFVQLDGEEQVDLYSLKRRTDGSGEPETVAARLVCGSRRCVVDGRAWSRVVVELPGTAYDWHDDPARDPDPRIVGRNPFEVRNEHIAWHRSNFPEHPRVALDRWLVDHAMLRAPEPAEYEEWGGAKFDQALAIARAEQAAQKAGASR